MEIKTTLEIKKISEQTYTEEQSKKWVAIDDIKKEIKKHNNCSEYHHLEGIDEDITCLDIIFKELTGNCVDTSKEKQNG